MRHLQRLSARRAWRAVAAGLSAVLLTATAGAQTRVQATEDEIKAEYLFKFNDYVQWPIGTIEKSQAFGICVVADEPFTRVVGDVLRDRRVREKPIVLRRPESATLARQCHVVYLSRAELARSDYLLEVLEHQPVLLVSDAADFLERGGTIDLSDTSPASQLLATVERIDGFERVARCFGTGERESDGLRAAIADFILEGLCALKKISRTDSGQLHASPSPAASRERPDERTLQSLMDDDETPVKGKKKYYN